MIFSCFPPQTDCEWANLRDFVIEYNEDRGTRYVREECLDKDTTRKHPEVLLRAPSERDIVIECKSVVWPAAYYRDHNNEHHLNERVSELLIEMCRNGAYELSYHESSLKGKKRREVERYAKQIAREVRSNWPRVERDGLSGKDPMPWRFRPLGIHEIEYDEPITGIRIEVRVGSVFLWEPAEYQRVNAATKAGYGGEFRRMLRKAAPKFEGYDDCLKMLLVQFCGEGSTVLLEKDLIDIIETTSLPAQIDEVWLAWQDWADDHSYRLRWKRVRTAEPSHRRASTPEHATPQ